MTSLPQVPELGSGRQLYLSNLVLKRKGKSMHSPRDVHKMGEGVGVEVECDRGRSATENALSARILVCG